MQQSVLILTPWSEGQMRLQRFWDCNPHQKIGQLLSTENYSHRFINVCWRLCVNSVIMIVNSRISCEEFSYQKRSLSLSLCVVPTSCSPRRISALSSLLGSCEVLPLSLLVRRKLEIVFYDRPHRGYPLIHVFRHLSRRSLRVPSPPLSDSFNHLHCPSSARSSTS